MEAGMEQTPATNVNPILSIDKNGTVLFSNEAGNLLLNEWGVKIGEKLPSYIEDLVQIVISKNCPEKTEFKVGNRTYLIVFSPLPEQELVSISGFDISDHKGLGEESKQSEKRLKALMDHNPSLVFMKDECGRYVYLNNAYEKQFVHSKDWCGKTDFDFWSKESAELFREHDSHVLESGQMHQFMEDSNDLSGTRYCWLCYKFPFTDSKNRKYVGGIGIDATDRVEAEEALQESEERYRMLFTRMTEGFVLVEVIYNEDGTPCDYRYLEMNPTYELSTGVKKGEALGKRIKEAFPNINPMVIEKLREVELSGESTNFEMFSRVINRYFDIHMFIPQKGKIAGIFEDITERKVAEDDLKKAHYSLEEMIIERTEELEKAYNSLKEREESLAEAQEMANIGNWVWDTKTDKAYWSDELYRIFGRSPQESAPTYNEYLNYVHPDDLDYVANEFKKAAVDGKSYSIDHRIVLDNGEERTVHIKSEIIFDEKNTPVRVKGIVQDITERKKAEEKIKAFANIVESSSDAIITTSLEGNVISWNKGAEQIYGYSPKEIIGKNVSILEPANLKGEIKQLSEQIKQGGKVQQYETLRLKKDGSIINAAVTISPVFDSSGKLMAISGIVRDITRRIKAEKELAKAEEARIKEIHHRVKNNLQVISSLLSLQAEKFNDAEVLEAFKESQNRVGSIALIHEELYKRDNTNTLNFADYLLKLTTNLLNSYQVGRDNISLKLDLDQVYLNIDTAIPLGIIVNELISNSLKHAFPNRQKGEIRISLQRAEDELNKEGCGAVGECKQKNGFEFVLKVSDNGVGIPKEMDFQNADTLGLQLVYTLVEQIDGCLELKSDKGTEFTIWFSNVEA